MAATLEERVEALERKLAELQVQPWLSPPVKKDPLSIFGAAKDDPLFEESVKLGEEWRTSQTYEKEIEARAGAGH